LKRAKGLVPQIHSPDAELPVKMKKGKNLSALPLYFVALAIYLAAEMVLAAFLHSVYQAVRPNQLAISS